MSFLHQLFASFDWTDVVLAAIFFAVNDIASSLRHLSYEDRIRRKTGKR